MPPLHSNIHREIESFCSSSSTGAFMVMSLCRRRCLRTVALALLIISLDFIQGPCRFLGGKTKFADLFVIFFLNIAVTILLFYNRSISIIIIFFNTIRSTSNKIKIYCNQFLLYFLLVDSLSKNPESLKILFII